MFRGIIMLFLTQTVTADPSALNLDIWSVATRLVCAMLVGMIIGIEREYTHRPAGLRTHILVALGAVLVFVGQAFIQTLMLMFLADTVEYGQWKLGKRNESVTFSIQPLINKIGGAISTGVVSLTLIISGIKIDGGTVDAIGDSGKLIVKGAMFVLPLLFIVLGYIIYLKKYKISEEFYAEILQDLEAKEQ